MSPRDALIAALERGILQVVLTDETAAKRYLNACKTTRQRSRGKNEKGTGPYDNIKISIKAEGGKFTIVQLATKTRVQDYIKEIK